MFAKVTWPQFLEQADHRKAIGETSVYLGDDRETFDSLDWSKCVRVEIGGSHRLEIATSVTFVFRANGMEGRWFFDIEPRSANGSRYYQIDTTGIQRVLSVLPPNPRRAFIQYLAECAVAVEKNANEYQEIATREYGMAGMLRALAVEAKIAQLA